MRHKTDCLLLILTSLVAGCGSSSSSTPDSGTTPDTGRDQSSPVVDAGQDRTSPVVDASPKPEASAVDTGVDATPFTFTPSNFTTSALSTTGAGAVEITGDCTADTDMQTLTGTGCLVDGAPVAYGVTPISLPGGGGHATVFIFTSLTIDAGATLTVAGSKPAIFYAQGTVSISGVISATGSTGAGALSTGAGVGVSPNGTGEGGGGGGFCGQGGLGGFEADGGNAPLPTVDGGYAGGGTYGTANLIPIYGGSQGGGEYFGVGGGAVQITSSVSIAIGAQGGVQANGVGGSEDNNLAGGGGSGGAILLEAPTVTVAGTVTANGGGGGDAVAGSDAPGATGNFTTTPSAPAGGAGAAGGSGAAGTVTKGRNGLYLPGMTDIGAGGGGVGWIRINTQSGMASVTGTVSPALTTACATQGKLGS